jgi:hypothetical protein
MAMKRCFGWSLCLTVGILLGMASSPYQVTHADPTADDQSADSDAPKAGPAATLAELKEIKTQLKEINAHLHTGVVKVNVLMNPELPPSQ